MYFIKRPGWLIKDTSEKEIKHFENIITKGASFIVITDKTFLECKSLKKYIDYKAGEKDNISVNKINCEK